MRAMPCRRACLDRTIQWHVLRHTFASHLVMRGEPLKLAFGAWCSRASSVDPKHVPGLRARPPLARSSSHAGNTSSKLVEVTRKSRDSDSGRSPLVRCGKYVPRACTLDLAPVQVRDTFGVLLNRAPLEVPFGMKKDRSCTFVRWVKPVSLVRP